MKINEKDLTKNKYSSIKECFMSETLPLVNIKDIRGRCYVIKKDEERSEKVAKLSLKELLA